MCAGKSKIESVLQSCTYPVSLNILAEVQVMPADVEKKKRLRCVLIKLQITSIKGEIKEDYLGKTTAFFSL